MTDAAPNGHPLLSVTNSLAETLASGRAARGLFLLTGDSMLAELVGVLGFEWAVLDMEASPMSKQDAFHCLQALTGSGCSPVIRVPFLHRHYIEHALDIGAHAILVPKVDSAADAAAAAAACRFPPDGNRGINPVRASGYFGSLSQYFSAANQRTMCLVQIESVAAVHCADEIAATPGVDGLFMGMGDLASAYHQVGVVTGPAIDQARATVLAAAARHGRHAGIFAYSLDLARQYVDEGFTLLGIGNDVKLFREAAAAALQAVPTMPSVALPGHASS